MNALKGKEILQYGVAGINPEAIKLSEERHSQKDTFCDSACLRDLQ